MIETIVQNYLNAALDPVKAYMEEPLSGGPKYVVIEKTGGGSTNRIKSATLAVKSYGASLYEAAALNEMVKAAMDNIVSLNDVSACGLNSDYNYTDTAKKKYRYQAVFDLVYF